MNRPLLSHVAHLALLALLPLGLAGAQQATAPILRQVTVEVPADGLRQLLALDFDVIYSHPETGATPGRDRFDLLVDDLELERLRSLEIPFDVVHQDLARFYAERLAAGPAPTEGASLGAWLSPPFGQGSMGGYYTWTEVSSVLDQIAAAYPAIVTPKTSIGFSLEGREQWIVKVSDNPGLDENEPEVRFDSMHHAREPESMQTNLWTLLFLVENYGTDPRATWIVDNREIYFLPVVNPDGYVYNQTTNPAGGGLWRKNRRNNGDGTFGIDLNRNYDFQWGIDNVGSSPSTSSETYRGPSPASEPEIQNMQSFFSNRSFVTAISAHTYSNLWLYTWGYTASLPPNAAQYDEISTHATEINGYEQGPASVVLYPANGVTIDYDQGVNGTLSWTPEIGGTADGFWPPQSRIVPLAEENLEAFLRTALSAGAYARVIDVTLTDVGDGDGFFEADETVEIVLTVRNGGLSGTVSTVTADLSSTSGGITLGTTSVDLGSLASFTSADNGATPLTLDVNSGTPSGTRIDYEILVAWDGFTEIISGSFFAGEPVDFVRDDLETQLGWLSNLPGDTATTGLWEYGDPVGTFNGSDPSNPENDATLVGVNAWTTGNGSTSSGGDDVDDGFTTLISPAIDLSGVASARISYARWYANFSSFDDVFEVSISDDDGQTWVSLENVNQTANAWNRVSFFVSDFVALTANVRLRFIASDDPNNSITEASVDDLLVETFDADPRFNIFGSSEIGTSIAFHTAGPSGGIYGIFESNGTGLFNFANINGSLLLDPLTMALLVNGNLPVDGLARNVLSIPNDPILQGITLYYQALISGPGGLFLTNRDEILFE